MASQVLVLISALSIIGVATFTQRLINEGMVAEDPEAILRSGFWMFILALVAGLALGGAAALAVFFSQGTAYVIRAELYRKIQTYSFGNFDRFRTGNLLVRLNADVKTSFVIAHRLATIRDSAKILVVNGGEIVEDGPHDELMAQKGFYYALYVSQFKGQGAGRRG